MSQPALNMEPESPFASLLELCADLAKGKAVLLVDDETRENEADIVVAADFATPEALAFMIRQGGGLICLALEARQCDKLALPLMPRRNLLDNQANFTVSIEACTAVTTGISAKDRARTIAAAIHADTTAQDISTPGHVFPLRAHENGLAGRAGHTEASIALAAKAGLTPAAVICELLDEKGETIKGRHVLEFAAQHNLKAGRIDRLKNELLP